MRGKEKNGQKRCFSWIILLFPADSACTVHVYPQKRAVAFFLEVPAGTGLKNAGTVLFFSDMEKRAKKGETKSEPRVVNSFIWLLLGIAVVLGIFIWFIVNRTTFGYELRTCGANRDAAKWLLVKWCG